MPTVRIVPNIQGYLAKPCVCLSAAPQDSRWRAQRAALVPLLRKYLLHPSALVRSSALGALYMLGCLKEKHGSEVPLESTRLALDADKVRRLIRPHELARTQPGMPAAHSQAGPGTLRQPFALVHSLLGSCARTHAAAAAGTPDRGSE